MLTTKVFDGLNDDQKEAASHLFGPCYIIAGPGSGKTLTLVRKIAYAIQNGANPKNMMVFTFTNKAAKEIKERVTQYVGESANVMTIGTYHSVCARLLRSYAEHLGYGANFSILDKEDSLTILKELCKNTDMNPKAMLSYISNQKRQRIDYKTAVSNAIGIDEKRAGIYRDYELRLKKQNSFDFDNLIFKMVELLLNHEDVRKKLHKKYEFVYCDETQDSSTCDLSFISLIINENQNVTLIMDDDQSIYQFRGADVASVAAFREMLDEPKTFVLKQNYRSSETIVNASRSLIGKNTSLFEKTIFSKNGAGDKIIYAEEKTLQKEALRIVSFIKLMRSEKYNIAPSEIAVLYRTNSFCNELEKALLKNNIVYQVIGNVAFYGRQEIKDIMAYLKFSINPYDYQAFKRIINLPKRNIGKSNLEKLKDFAEEHEVDYLTSCRSYEAFDKTPKAFAEGLKSFIDVIDKLSNDFAFSAPVDVLQYLFDTLKYADYIKQTHKEDFEERLEHLDQLLEIASSYASIQEMLEESSLQSCDDESKKQCITLMTMHASKGLEYDCVIIGGCSEELIPFIKAIEEDNIEEERRLLYVGLTRARKYLFLTRSQTVKFGNHFKTLKESRFLKEINHECVFKMRAT